MEYNKLVQLPSFMQAHSLVSVKTIYCREYQKTQ